MSTLTQGVARPGILRYSRWDALLILLALAQGILVLLVPSAMVIALGLWWNSNTIAHNFLHKPFFRARALNALFALYLTVLLGIPQSLWRSRHLAHHAGVPWRLRLSAWLLGELALVLLLWWMLLLLDPWLFLCAYLPGYVVGLGLCSLHGYYEHHRGTLSHYGALYNLLFFNDGYHVEHHAHPGRHWTHLPRRATGEVPHSRWPAVLRWLDCLSLEGLERWVLRSPRLQRFVLTRHEKALRALLVRLSPAPQIAIVGGGLFPRTLLILQRLFPDAAYTVIDASGDNLAIARAFVQKEVVFRCEWYDPARLVGFDLVVFPLAFVGNRQAIYQAPPAPLVLVHDWIWRRRGRSAIVSVLLLKRVNLVTR
jgi:hypothetical protein